MIAERPFMKLTRLMLIAGILFFCFAIASAKENKDLIRANFYYSHFAYFEAIPYFEKIAGELNNPIVYSELADCYSVTNNLQKASAAYTKAVNLPGCSSAVVLRYAQLLMQLTQYDEAARWLLQYQKIVPNDKRAANLIAGCNSAKELLTAFPKGVANLLPFNTDGSEFAPSIWNGHLVFASDTSIDVKKKTDNWTGKSYYNIYSIACDNKGHCGNEFNKLTETRQLNNKYHDGPATFSANGKQMYFTRSRYSDHFLSHKSVSNKDSVVLLEIMIASDYDTASKKFKTVEPFQYNSKEYAVAHPTVSPAGKLLVFSSTMPKGAGGSDLYICKKLGHTWMKPKRVGNIINTEGEEVFPYWADDSTLFFSSDGHEGLGGLDIYKCTWQEAHNTFTQPENIGAPINSSYDDISLALFSDGRSTYFSSNRPAAKGGDNIWFYKREKIFLQLNVFDSITRQSLANVGVDLNTSAINKDTTTNDAGKLFTRLYPETEYNLTISKTEYTSASLHFVATTDKEADTIYRDVYLYKRPPRKPDTMAAMPTDPPVVNANVMDTPGIQTFQLNEVYEIGRFYYDYNKADLKPEHKRFMDTMLVQLHRHPTMRIQIRAHTDCRGSVAFNADLSERRALAVVNYLVSHGIPRNRLEYIGLGFSQPTVKCPICEQCTEHDHYLNRVLDFKVLQL